MKELLKILLLLLLLAGCIVGTFFKRQPNFVFILTDDQDQEQTMISTIMPKLASLVGDKGANLSNAFTASPLCCPSRAGIFTGQHVHNHKTINNTLTGDCFSLNWQKGPEKNTFPVLLQKNGYTTFHVGKYLNLYGRADLGDLAYIPPGWDDWIALQGNSVYYNYNLSVNGAPVYHGNDTEKDYLPLVIKNESLKFIEKQSKDKPFFMMLSTPSCHDPFVPEEQYKNHFNDMFLPITPHFNIPNVNKNWFAQLGEQPLRQEVIDKLQISYRNRLRTLLTVDDTVECVVQALERKKLIRDTYIIYTSDHGYHLGQFSLFAEKSQPYEFDIRVPFLIRGPGIKKGITIKDITTNIDIAPTLLDLADIPIPSHMDGISLKDVLLQRKTYDNFLPPPKRDILVEHSGQGRPTTYPGCEYLGTGLNICLAEYDCKCIDSKNNTYNCVRTLGDGTDEVYCSWTDYPFEEYYDLKCDPWQITNSIGTIKVRDAYLNEKLNLLLKCSGSNCNGI